MNDFLNAKAAAEKDKALAFATEAHEGQVRKSTGEPYIGHPVAVAEVLEAFGADEDVVIAGLLHDVVEDTPYTLHDISVRFGPKVAWIVDYVTEQDKALGWEERKAAYLRRLADGPREARMVCLADKAVNMQDTVDLLVEEGPSAWKVFKRGREVKLAQYRRCLYVASVDAPEALVKHSECIYNALANL